MLPIRYIQIDKFDDQTTDNDDDKNCWNTLYTYICIFFYSIPSSPLFIGSKKQQREKLLGNLKKKDLFGVSSVTWREKRIQVSFKKNEYATRKRGNKMKEETLKKKRKYFSLSLLYRDILPRNRTRWSPQVWRVESSHEDTELFFPPLSSTSSPSYFYISLLCIFPRSSTFSSLLFFFLPLRHYLRNRNPAVWPHFDKSKGSPLMNISVSGFGNHQLRAAYLVATFLQFLSLAPTVSSSGGYISWTIYRH